MAFRRRISRRKPPPTSMSRVEISRITWSTPCPRNGVLRRRIPQLRTPQLRHRQHHPRRHQHRHHRQTSCPTRLHLSSPRRRRCRRRHANTVIMSATHSPGTAMLRTTAPPTRIHRLLPNHRPHLPPVRPQVLHRPPVRRHRPVTHRISRRTRLRRMPWRHSPASGSSQH